jgi:hypothetical protein
VSHRFRDVRGTWVDYRARSVTAEALFDRGLTPTEDYESIPAPSWPGTIEPNAQLESPTVRIVSVILDNV